MISQNDVVSEHGSIAFTINKNDKESIVKMFESLDLKYNILINENVSKISLVGLGF